MVMMMNAHRRGKKSPGIKTRACRGVQERKEKVFGYLVGQAMRETKGKADPQKLGRILKDELAK